VPLWTVVTKWCAIL